MPIKKQYLKSKPVCKVTFTLPGDEATSVVVAGNWNNWSTSETQLKKLKNGNFKGTLDLESGKSYEFKYVVDGEWQNDAQADAYTANAFATENSVLNL
ncbi:isoamylase early set domain-containing protein [Winogradskyella maritima]|uniref:Isoamylase early set domain-containing protein n=1 Tax=Winogradskyella maritima TaxID=1517766 RepID=A0ABV8AEI9_9FLAO|nr:isoamylase early set domain-containing protein [Winogradskyella maritima]